MKIIITESQNENLEVILKQIIKSKGIEIAIISVNGLENLFQIMNINSPRDFLNLFNDLKVSDSDEIPAYTLFRYKPENNILIYWEEGMDVDINYKIWEILEDNFGLEYGEVQKLTKKWVFDVYNLYPVSTHKGHSSNDFII